MNFVGYLAVGYASVLVITDLAAVSGDSAVVAVEFAAAGIEIVGTEVAGTEIDNSVVADTGVAETGIDSSVFADTEGVGVATAGTEGSDLMIGCVEDAEIDVHHRARCNAFHLDGICSLCGDCTPHGDLGEHS